MFIMILHYTCTGPFNGGIAVIGLLFLNLGRGTNIFLICFLSMVLICSMNLNIYVGSYWFFYILSLRQDVMSCNSKTVWFFPIVLLLDLSVPLQGIPAPLKVLGHWIYHNTLITQQYYGVVFDHFHLIIQLVFLAQNMNILSIDRLVPGTWRILWSFFLCWNEWRAAQTYPGMDIRIVPF